MDEDALQELRNALTLRDLMVGYGVTFSGATVPPETAPRELRISLIEGDDNDLDLGDGEPGSLDKVVACLQAARARAPVEYQDSVRCCIEINHGYYDSGASLEADVWYTRMETPEEVAARIAKDKADRERRKQAEEAQERRKLAALKAKYGES